MWSKPFIDANAILEDDFSSYSCKPALFLLFGPTDELLQSELPKKIHSKFPNAIVTGCSAATAFSNSLISDDGITGLVMGFEKTNLAMTSQPISAPSQSFSVGARLGSFLKEPDLAAVFVISDGLNVNGSDVVGGILSVLGGRIPVSGGLASDGARFEKTLVIENGEVKEKSIVAIGFYGDALKVSHGSDGGWEDFGDTWEITKSNANAMMELDHKSAFDFYVSQMGDERKDLPASGLLYPVRIWHPKYPEHDMVRTLLAVDEANGTLTFAGDVPSGWNARLMRATNNMLISGANQSALAAMEGFASVAPNLSPTVAFGVSCIGRRLLMGDDTQKEISQVKNTLKGAEFIGFHSYGEIAPHKKTRLCSLHNQTMTLTLMTEA